jgi:quinol monooxygenase YgiN
MSFEGRYSRWVIVVAGALYVEPGERSEFLVGCRTVVEQARNAEGCLDFAISADLLDLSRINVFERWTDRTALVDFRDSGPSDDQNDAISRADVREFCIDE